MVPSRRSPRRCIRRIRDDAAEVVPLTQRRAATNLHVPTDGNSDISSEDGSDANQSDEFPFPRAQPSWQRNPTPGPTLDLSDESSCGEVSDTEEVVLRSSSFVKPTNDQLQQVVQQLVAIQGPCNISLLGTMSLNIIDTSMSSLSRPVSPDLLNNGVAMEADAEIASFAAETTSVNSQSSDSLLDESQSQATSAQPSVQTPVVTPTTRLDMLYPMHARTLSVLLETGYKDAYKTCLRTRVLLHILDDMGANPPIEKTHIMQWVSEDSLKTHKNNISRLNTARKVLDYLRGLPSVEGQDLADMKTLAVLLEGPPVPVPFDRASRDEGSDNKTIDIALHLSISKLEQINKRFKQFL